KRNGKQHVQGFFGGVIGHVQQNENDDEHNWYNDLKPLLGANLVFVLSAPFDVITRRHTHALGDDTFCILDKSAHVAPTNVHQHSPAKYPILAGNHRWSHTHTNMSDVP